MAASPPTKVAILVAAVVLAMTDSATAGAKKAKDPNQHVATADQLVLRMDDGGVK